MGAHKDSGRVNLHTVFSRVRQQMLAGLSVGDVFEHPTAAGAATEQQWIQLFNQYLPQRYRATSAFIVDADGRRSRQIDIAVYDHFYAPLLFHHESGLHIPAESVYAVFEVKTTLTAKWLADAARKVASVRRLRRTSAPVLSAGSLRPPMRPPPILAGILALSAIWAKPFENRLTSILRRMPPAARLDLGCALQHGAFEVLPDASAFTVHFTSPDDSLFYFVLRLLHRLQQMGTAPALDLAQYARSLPGFPGK